MKATLENFKVTVAFGIFTSTLGLAIRHIVGYSTTFECEDS